jgi:hypothetical protein
MKINLYVARAEQFIHWLRYVCPYIRTRGTQKVFSGNVVFDNVTQIHGLDLYIHSPIRLHGVVLKSLSTGTTSPLLQFVDTFKF